MKIKLQNLGILKTAEFELGDLTIICGKNNTGKTYAVYTLYGFLRLWRNIISIEPILRHSRELIDSKERGGKGSLCCKFSYVVSF